MKKFILVLIVVLMLFFISCEDSFILNAELDYFTVSENKNTHLIYNITNTGKATILEYLIRFEIISDSTRDTTDLIRNENKQILPGMMYSSRYLITIPIDAVIAEMFYIRSENSERREIFVE